MTSRSSSAYGLRSPCFIILASMLLGFASGTAWFAALMPVGVTGAVGYDLSRYGFSAGILAVLASLLYRPWRGWRFCVSIAGFVLGILPWLLCVPISVLAGGLVMYVAILFGAPLAVVAVLSVGLCLGSRAGDRNDPAKVPRRFGVGTLLVVVLSVSLLFAAARWLDVPPPLTIFGASFLAVIGALQMLVTRVPRAVSVAAGAIILPMTLAATWSASGANSHPLFRTLVTTPADIVFGLAHLAAVGAVCGYVGGVLAAGLFLVIDAVGMQPLRARSSKETHLQSASALGPAATESVRRSTPGESEWE